MDTLLYSPLLRAHGFAHGFGTRNTSAAELPAPFLAKQVHGAHIHALRLQDTREAIAALPADGLLSAPGAAAVAVRTADCVPLLLAHRQSGHVAAVHAGWRGICAQILSRAVALLGDPRELFVAIGPCIGACCFEVSADVAEQLRTHGGDGCIREQPGRKPHVDLQAAIRFQLQSLQITQFDAQPFCARCDAARFHSYRRDGERAGRMQSFIVPRDAHATQQNS